MAGNLCFQFGGGPVPKVLGADVEFGNFIAASDPRPAMSTSAMMPQAPSETTDFEAAYRVLSEIPGTPAGVRWVDLREVSGWVDASSLSGVSRRIAPPDGGAAWESFSLGNALPPPSYRPWDESESRHGPRPGDGALLGPLVFPDPFDLHRKFLPSTGGSIYVDNRHLEACLPEVTSARDFVASWHAILRTVARAVAAANAKVGDGRRIHVLANNCDGHGSSFGSHVNVLLSRHGWQAVCQRKPHYLHGFASYLVSSIVYTGAGKVTSDGSAEDAEFQICQRADHFEQIVGEQTTYSRPLVNTRDEPHADEARLARAHVIFPDSCLCPIACFLKAGALQLMLAMLEQGVFDGGLLLEDPLLALRVWSRDPDLGATAALASGAERSAVELQRGFLDLACRFVAQGRAEGIVPHASQILAVWGSVLDRLVSDVDSLVSSIDWVLKRAALREAVQRFGLTWGDGGTRYLDQIFHSVDPGEGLFWTYERLGLIEPVVGAEEIERFSRDPPEDTRAWTRAQLLRQLPAERVSFADWERIRVDAGSSSGPRFRTLEMPDPLGFTRHLAESAFQNAHSVDELLDLLGVPDADRRPFDT